MADRIRDELADDQAQIVYQRGQPGIQKMRTYELTRKTRADRLGVQLK